jgi:predicted TIM-barrel fold metal-dependent hydrolase
VDAPEWLERLQVVDVDSHLTEPPSLWTSRAPARYRDRVPHVRSGAGTPVWVVDGSEVGPATGHSVIMRDRHKGVNSEVFGYHVEDVHAAAWDAHARLQIMDEQHLAYQVVYPNLAGFGNRGFASVADSDLRQLCVSIYNDAMAEFQEQSGGRLLPMAVVPWWDPIASTAEARRAAAMGLRGIAMCSDPHDRGAPDLGEAAWDPFWEACLEHGLPVNFHIGASDSTHSWYGSSPWPSQSDPAKLAIGGIMLFLGNAKVILNLIVSGVLDRHPDLKFVSVESGAGWVPFVIEALQYNCREEIRGGGRLTQLDPAEYFHRQIFMTFWFEQLATHRLLDVIGPDNLLFETDFPHPTCLYPTVLDPAFEQVDEVSRRKIFQDNASALYKLPLAVDG